MKLRTLALAAAVAAAAASPAPPTCGIATYNDTLGYLQPAGVTHSKANSSSACCAACVASAACASWSFSGKTWTPATPCHLSGLGFEKRQSGSAGHSCGSARPPPPPPSMKGTYVIDVSAGGLRQVFEGVEVELQADSIGSDNEGMPKEGQLVPDADNSTRGAPHDLAPAERERFATQVLRGVRTIRLAMGLFLRGLGPQNRSIVGRWPSQMAELRQLQQVRALWFRLSAAAAAADV